MIIEKETSVESGRAVVILHIEGLIKLGESAAYFVTACKKLKDQDVVLDLADVDYIDSTGIGELIGSGIALARAGYKLALVNVQARITKLLEIAHAIRDLQVLTDFETTPYRAGVDTTPPIIGHYLEDQNPETVLNSRPTVLVTLGSDTPLAISIAKRTKHMRRITVYGKVQRVGYRFFATRVARRMGLKGWIQNMPDGSVVACVEGDRTIIDEWLEILREGPRYSAVTRIEQELLEFTGTLQDFDVRF